jgi:hypothetical protein
LWVAFTAFMVVGAVIVAHRPRNAIGWIFSAIGLLAATGMLTMEYAAYAYVTRPGSLPGAILAAWYQWWWGPDAGPDPGLHPVVVPHRSAAVGSLAAGSGGGGRGCRDRRAERPAAIDHTAEPERHRPQPHRGGRRPGAGGRCGGCRALCDGPGAVSQRSSRWCSDFGAREA